MASINYRLLAQGKDTLTILCCKDCGMLDGHLSADCPGFLRDHLPEIMYNQAQLLENMQVQLDDLRAMLDPDAPEREEDSDGDR